MFELIAYPPVLRGFILLLVSGFAFPLAGVFILRMNLLPLRFLMMHGVLLGGALGLAFGIDLSITSLAVNLVLVFLLNRSRSVLKEDYGYLSMFFMIMAIGVASVIVSRYNVPARDTLALLWGSLYANNAASLIAAAGLGMALIAFSVLNFRRLTAIFQDKDVALSLGINVALFEFAVMLLTALVVASAMRLMGALLMDAIIILPVVIASLIATGLRRTMILASLFGGGFALCGFLLSLAFDIPVSAGVSLPAGAVFLLILILQRGFYREETA